MGLPPQELGALEAGDDAGLGEGHGWSSALVISEHDIITIVSYQE
jgi:hypothetical protein